MTRQDAAAYRSGAAAFRAGKLQDANPYPASMHANHCWLVGYINAKVAAAERKPSKRDFAAALGPCGR